MVIFVENPTATANASALDKEHSLFVSVPNSDACSKMKQVFNWLVYPAGEFCRIYEWVGLNNSVIMFYSLI